MPCRDIHEFHIHTYVTATIIYIRVTIAIRIPSTSVKETQLLQRPKDALTTNTVELFKSSLVQLKVTSSPMEAITLSGSTVTPAVN